MSDAVDGRSSLGVNQLNLFVTVFALTILADILVTDFFNRSATTLTDVFVKHGAPPLKLNIHTKYITFSYIFQHLFTNYSKNA